MQFISRAPCNFEFIRRTDCLHKHARKSGNNTHTTENLKYATHVSYEFYETRQENRVTEQ